MSDPSFDRSTGWWSIRYYAGPGRPRPKVMLMKHPGWAKGQRPPRKPPEQVEALARKYRDLEVQARHGIEVAPARSVALAAHLDEYRKGYAATRRPGSVAVLRRSIGHFTAFCAGRGIGTIGAVTPAHCREFVLGRMAVARPNTVIMERRMLAACWKQAVRDGLLARNPWDVGRIEGLSAADQEEPPHWSEEELVRLLAECRGCLRDLATVSVNSGVRITCLLHLEWRDVDPERRRLVIRPDNPGNKTRRRCDAPLLDGALEVLGRRREARDTENAYVFPSPRSGRPMRSNIPFVAMGRAARRAGLPKKGRWNHILRHTFVSLCLQRGIPLPVVSRWAGHRSIAMTMRYYHHSPDDSVRFARGLSFGTTPSAGRTPPPPATGPS